MKGTSHSCPQASGYAITLLPARVGFREIPNIRREGARPHFSSAKAALGAATRSEARQSEYRGRARGQCSCAQSRRGSSCGTSRALLPFENTCNFLEVTGDIMEHVDPIFFGDPTTAKFKALGLN
jgi:hypothetical protein